MTHAIAFSPVSAGRWRLEKSRLHGMQTNAEIIASAAILEAANTDGSIQQVLNVAMLPGIVGPALAMPDIHYGYGFCIGGVAAFHATDGIVLPGGVGYDINCGVRLLTTTIPEAAINKLIDSIGYALLKRIPTGLHAKPNAALERKEFMRLLASGAHYVVAQTGSDPAELDYIESNGRLHFDNPQTISEKAIERGKTQLGSLGSGNHFIEIQRVAEIFDAPAAAAYGLQKNCLAVMIHTGSRGFGHQIATDYIERLRKKYLKQSQVKDPQLVYAPIASSDGAAYLQALNAACNFAWANRQLLQEQVIAILEEFFHASRHTLGIRLVYDQAHNIAKFEEHNIAGNRQNLLVHRKGASRAFPAGQPSLPARYQSIGQPVLIPGSMGTSSYILKGTATAMSITFGSTAHGAGRRLSRHQALKIAAKANIQEALRARHIHVFSLSSQGLKEEIPEAYKDIDDVIAATTAADISQTVARTTPLLVVKG